MSSRRNFITGILAGISTSAFGKSPLINKATPPETKGPFYPVYSQADKDFDLTRIKGSQKTAKGKTIIIEGKVMDTNGNPLSGAIVDLWQANAAGRYRHPRDPNNAALDPGFQGWAIITSGSDGTFRFKTIFPGAYPASVDWMRPPHIHFKIDKTGYTELVTQMYFPDNELNKGDLLLMQKSDAEVNLMTAVKISDSPETYLYNIILSKN